MKLFFDMAIVDERGKVHARLRREIDEQAAFMGERIGGDLRAGVFGPFDSVVRVLKIRQFRRELLRHAAMVCGDALADHLEDREGWHGEDRQERVEAQYRGRI